MKVSIQENVVEVNGGIDVTVTDTEATFDDGKLTVQREGGGFRVTAEGYATIETDTNTASNQRPTYDPHVYSSWTSNGLLFEDSVYRASEKVIEMANDDGIYFNRADLDIIDEKVEDIIADPDTEGRHSVYSLAGGILKGFREGDYAGVPFAWVFKGLVEGYIQPPAETVPSVRDYFTAFGS
jgi:hypothetical protein